MNAISVKNLQKSYGAVKALDGIDLEVPEAEIFGLLGPNGAGKTTLVRALTTLLKPDSGEALVLGLNVVKDAQKLRRLFGLAGQYAAVDETLTGRENLELVGRLYHLEEKQVLTRATELLEQFGLTEAGDRTVKTYSGGMRRRLDLALSLVGDPKIIFLDEPTTGLDPQSRIGLWNLIRQLAKRGVTVLLTTQYLEEADQLASMIAVIDHGKIVALGTPTELKAKFGADVVEVEVKNPAQRQAAVLAISDLGVDQPKIDEQTGWISMPIQGGVSALMQVIRKLDIAGIQVSDILLHRPTLDDVFLKLTGHKTQN